MSSDFSDAALAERVARELLIDRFNWSAALGWHRYDGRRWRPVSEAEPIELVRAWVMGEHIALAEAVRTGEEDVADLKRHTVVLSRAKISNVVALARGIAGVLVDAAEFDRHPLLLNVENGVVDLATGDLRPHDPRFMLTRLAAVAYRPGTRHPAWDAALGALPPDVREWVQLRYGQAATGLMPSDDLLIVQQGGGENGKTTFAGAVSGVLGDYFALIPDKVLLGTPSDHPTELMTLRGARFALVEETPEARRLAVGRLKKTVGTPQITARLIRQDSVTFDSTHSLFLSTNYRPIIEETDHGTWRRLALLRFPYRFTTSPTRDSADRPADPRLRDQVKADPQAREAVLAWLVEGAVAWHRAGGVVAMPDRVAEDTRRWRSESDGVLAFCDDRLVFDPTWHVTGRELFAEFSEWLAQRGQAQWSEKLFVSRFEEHSEVTLAGVTRRRMRAPAGASDLTTGRAAAAAAGLSRRGPTNLPTEPLAAQYTGWQGVRFRAPEEQPRGRLHGVPTGDLA